MRAVCGDPVNATRSTSGCPVSGAPASAPLPFTTLSTPGGSPASRASSPSIVHVSGAHSGGFSTTVLPAASAGPTRQVASMNGAFQGVETAVTPAGSWRTRLRSPPCRVRAGSSRRSTAQSAKKRMLLAPRGSTRSRIASSSEPLSTVSTAARSGTAASIASASRDRYGSRPSGPSAAHAPKASRAAATAASTSPRPPALTSASFQPSQSSGLRTSNVVSLSTHSPPIRCAVGTFTPSTSVTRPPSRW